MYLFFTTSIDINIDELSDRQILQAPTKAEHYLPVGKHPSQKVLALRPPAMNVTVPSEYPRFLSSLEYTYEVKKVKMLLVGLHYLSAPTPHILRFAVKYLIRSPEDKEPRSKGHGGQQSLP
jgi:hypothetical protein